jgi:hypothetical protein
VLALAVSPVHLRCLPEPRPILKLINRSLKFKRVVFVNGQRTVGGIELCAADTAKAMLVRVGMVTLATADHRNPRFWVLRWLDSKLLPEGFLRFGKKSYSGPSRCR